MTVYSLIAYRPSSTTQAVGAVYRVESQLEIGCHHDEASLAAAKVAYQERDEGWELTVLVNGHVDLTDEHPDYNIVRDCLMAVEAAERLCHEARRVEREQARHAELEAAVEAERARLRALNEEMEARERAEYERLRARFEEG